MAWRLRPFPLRAVVRQRKPRHRKNQRIQRSEAASPRAIWITGKALHMKREYRGLGSAPSAILVLPHGKPPARGRMRAIPKRRSRSAICAAVTSFGQLQNRTISRSCGIASMAGFFQFRCVYVHRAPASAVGVIIPAATHAAESSPSGLLRHTEQPAF